MNKTVKQPIIPLDNCNIISKDQRYIEIYKIICFETEKCYIGQTVSHVLNTTKYRRYGMEKRLRCHISEAFSKKKNQCHYLNNSIRKYGADNFDVELLERCYPEESDDREAYYIIKYNTMFPNGYNLKLGTITTHLSAEGRKRVSTGVCRFYENKKYDRFDMIKIPSDIDDNLDKYIRPLRKYGKQYGWYVYIERKKADFGGIHILLEDSRKRAEEFINELKERYMARHLVAGTPT
jgi:hypothetical protein